MRTLKNLGEPQLSGLDYWVSGANQYGYMRKRYFGEKSYELCTWSQSLCSSGWHDFWVSGLF